MRVRSAKLLKRWSGRRGSNPRRPAWEAGILPLNYSRFLSNQLFSRFPITYARRFSEIHQISPVWSKMDTQNGHQIQVENVRLPTFSLVSISTVDSSSKTGSATLYHRGSHCSGGRVSSSVQKLNAQDRTAPIAIAKATGVYHAPNLSPSLRR